MSNTVANDTILFRTAVDTPCPLSANPYAFRPTDECLKSRSSIGRRPCSGNRLSTSCTCTVSVVFLSKHLNTTVPALPALGAINPHLSNCPSTDCNLRYFKLENPLNWIPPLLIMCDAAIALESRRVRSDMMLFEKATSRGVPIFGVYAFRYIHFRMMKHQIKPFVNNCISMLLPVVDNALPFFPRRFASLSLQMIDTQITTVHKMHMAARLIST